MANQAPAQIAAALHAQGKTYEDLVHMYADMVSRLLQQERRFVTAAGSYASSVVNACVTLQSLLSSPATLRPVCPRA